MLSEKVFWYGVGAGLIGLWVVHHFAMPLPGGKNK